MLSLVRQIDYKMELTFDNDHSKIKIEIENDQHKIIQIIFQEVVKENEE